MTGIRLIDRIVFPLSFAVTCLMALPAKAENYASWGIGYGVPYAYLGASIDYRIAPNFYLTGAAGTGINEFALAAGGRYYVLPALFEIARVRVSVMYGPYGGVSHVPAGTNSKRKEDFAGPSIGLGMALFSDNEGVDIDIFYTDTRDAKDKFDNYNAAGESAGRDGLDPVNVALGYRRRF